MLTRLTYCPPGAEIEIKQVDGGYGAFENLESLGLSIGSKIKLMHSLNGKGPVDVSFDDGIASIGRELASKIIVEFNNKIELTLDRIRVGDFVKVTRIKSDGDIRYRLLDMGLIRGATMKVVRLAPLGDPIEVKLDGFNLSLRREEATGIYVEIIKLGLNGLYRKSI